jgi:hypothetical protein
MIQIRIEQKYALNIDNVNMEEEIHPVRQNTTNVLGNK